MQPARAATSGPALTPISGVAGKGPACFLVEAGSVRLLLDLGYGPQPGLLPDVSGVGEVDALVLSHGHRDHAGGLSLMSKIGNPPVFATEWVCRGLPAGVESRVLPLAGSTDIVGIRVDTGRSGHAPGGVWLRLHVGGGLLYMGDHSSESILYRYDAPPPARTVILDASYGADDTPLARQFASFDAVFSAGDVLLPVPADGRGPEIALYLARRGCAVRVDEAVRAGLRRLAEEGRESLHPGTETEIARIAATAGPIDGTQGVMLASRADATAGEAARRVAEWGGAARPAIVFTGYVPPGTPAERLIKSGRARYLRWNVHPRLSDNVALVRSAGPATVVPAFCEREALDELARAFAPAEVAAAGVVRL
ncbi:MAG TPA: MBL fold metallo-hydrolase [candidate division Zixibacteria bacterium]|nr:MBL fold metallo-hydrolase [candidate division Zixibacteria bacterium]